MPRTRRRRRSGGGRRGDEFQKLEQKNTLKKT